MQTLPTSVRIVLIGHGLEPIPPQGWGAVEHVIWEYAQRLRKRGYEVEIINENHRKAVQQVFRLLRDGRPTVVHCHAEKPIRWLNLLTKVRPFLLVSTLHVPIAFPAKPKYQRKALKRTLSAPYHLVLRPAVTDYIKQKNPQATVVTFKNAVEVDRYAWSASTNGKAVCVGRIQNRKRQNEVAQAVDGSPVECDFIGPLREEQDLSEALKSRMVGEWDKDTLYTRLHEYGCLVLYSTSEGQPLVVMEALASGLPVVVSEAAAEGLDLSQPFIHLVKSDDQIVPAIQKALSQKEEWAPKIRAYAEEEFSYERRIDQYLQQLQDWLTP